jgi:L-threonylcarbamoyladenylate synthase
VRSSGEHPDRASNRLTVTEVITVDPRLPDAALIARAAARLRAGGLVAFPTETVYGLGVHALDRAAVVRLFAAKGRPADDPLIVHIASLEAARSLLTEIPASAGRLAHRFWPGPLTLVLPKSALVPDEVTASRSTVAIRAPSHPVARALIEAAGVPVAAPSANLFSRPSPTRAAHVLEDLEGRIDLVVDAGPTPVGVESTVLDLSGDSPVILRPGAVTLDQLREVLPEVRGRSAAAAEPAGGMPSPGLLEKHYSPRAPLTLYEGAPRRALSRLATDALAARAAGARVGIVAAQEDRPLLPAPGTEGVDIVDVGPAGDLPGVAARLYAALRELDGLGVDLILARAFADDGGLGDAIQDRLRRAAAGRIVRV